MIDTFDLKGRISKYEYDRLSQHLYVSKKKRKDNPDLPKALNEIAVEKGKGKIKPVTKYYNTIILNVRKFQGLGKGEGRCPIFKATLSQASYTHNGVKRVKYYLTLAIKPLALIDEWRAEFDTLAAEEFNQVEQGFNKTREKLKSLDIIDIPEDFFYNPETKLIRVDLTFDIDIPYKHTELYIHLLKKADFNFYHKNAKKEPNSKHQGIRVEYRQFALNIYNKQKNQDKKRRDSQHTKNLRIEIQLYKAFFNSNPKYNCSGRAFFEFMEKDILKLFNKRFNDLFKYCFRKGEYITTQKAETIINKSFTHKKKKKAVIKVLQTIVKKSIPETLKACEKGKLKASGNELTLAQCNTYLKELEKLNINPITISEELANKYGAELLHNLKYYF